MSILFPVIGYCRFCNLGMVGYCRFCNLGMATVMVAIAVALLVLSSSSLCSTRDVYIYSSESEHCPGTPCYNISTFGRMADKFFNSYGLVVHFLEGTHLLDLQELVVFMNMTNAVFEGDGRMEQGFHETVWQSTVVNTGYQSVLNTLVLPLFMFPSFD